MKGNCGCVCVCVSVRAPLCRVRACVSLCVLLSAIYWSSLCLFVCLSGIIVGGGIIVGRCVCVCLSSSTCTAVLSPHTCLGGEKKVLTLFVGVGLFGVGIADERSKMPLAKKRVFK